MTAWTFRRRRALGLLAVLAACSLLAAHASTAGAQVVFDKALHKSFGVLRVVGRSRAAASASRPSTPGPYCATSCTPMLYKGGPVQHGENVHLFFWGPPSSFPASYITGLAAWVNDVAAADGTGIDPFSVDTLYYDLSGPGASKSYVPYAVQNAGTITDTDAYPASGCSDGSTCLTDAQVQSELSAYTQAHSLPASLDDEYFVFTPPGVNTCFSSGNSQCSFSFFCAYHSYTSVAGTPVTYADLPYLYDSSGCDAANLYGAGHPNSNFIDPDVNVFTHELSETMTDPELNAWLDQSGFEVADKCDFVFSQGGGVRGLNKNSGGYWDQQLGSDVYLIQQIFDNQIDNCVPRLTETWSGNTVSANWSVGGNWAARLPPDAGGTSDGSVDTLSFPSLASAACTASRPAATCYTSSNDLAALSAYALSVDDGSGYSIGGNALTLGAGGVNATTSAGSPQPSAFNAPLTLGASQTWSIDGGAHQDGRLSLGGALTGSSDALTVDLSGAASLKLGASAEVGNVTIAGANNLDSGANALDNGSVTVAAALNGTDGNAVALNDAALLAPGSPTVGALTSTGADLEVGQAAMPAGKLTVQGGLALDAASRLRLYIDRIGTTAGTDYSQVDAHGNVTLGGGLVLGSAGACPALTLGARYTLLTTTGTLSGTFLGLPDGTDLQLSCTGTPPVLRINYTSSSVTGTVVTNSLPGRHSRADGSLGRQRVRRSYRR